MLTVKPVPGGKTLFLCVFLGYCVWKSFHQGQIKWFLLEEEELHYWKHKAPTQEEHSSLTLLSPGLMKGEGQKPHSDWKDYASVCQRHVK